MTQILLPFLLLMGAGAAWRRVSPRIPGAPDLEAQRGALVTLVFFFFLPALAFRVLYLAPLDASTWKIPLVSALSCLATAAAAWGVYSALPIDKRARGAMVLASGWSNATYLGYPIVIATFGASQGRVPILFDLLSLTPLLLTVGSAIALRSGSGRGPQGLQALLSLPAPFAAGLGLAFNALGIPVPEAVLKTLEAAGSTVAPLMIFTVGLLLRFSLVRHAGRILPALLLKLGLAPLLALGLVHALGLSGDEARATTLEAAMPTMVLSLVIAERFKLDSELLALAIAISTGLSFLTLNAWL